MPAPMVIPTQTAIPRIEPTVDVETVKSEPHLQPSVCGASQARKTKHLGVMFVCQIVDLSEDRDVRIDFVFGCEVHEGIILNVEIRSAEIQFFPRIHELRFRRRAKPFAPKIRSRNVNFIPRPTSRNRPARDSRDDRVMRLMFLPPIFGAGSCAPARKQNSLMPARS